MKSVVNSLMVSRPRGGGRRFRGGFGAANSHHGLCQGLLNERDAALVDGLTVGQEADLEGCGDRRQTLEKSRCSFEKSSQILRTSG